MADSSRVLEGQRGEGFRHWEAAANVVAQIVRKLSGAGRFANAADVLEELEGLALLPEAADEVPAALNEILSAALTVHPDLVPVEGGERKVVRGHRGRNIIAIAWVRRFLLSRLRVFR